jgi:hypothetical protein
VRDEVSCAFDGLCNGSLKVRELQAIRVFDDLGSINGIEEEAGQAR